MLVWRICKPAFTRLDGEGSRLYGGRWNSVGIPVIYTSGTRALTILETRWHERVLPKELVRVTIEIDDAPINDIDLSGEPNWLNDRDATCRLGDEYFTGPNANIPLRVPSVVDPEEFNILFSPQYALTGARVLSVTAVHFDERLWKGTPTREYRRPKPPTRP